MSWSLVIGKVQENDPEHYDRVTVDEFPDQVTIDEYDRFDYALDSILDMYQDRQFTKEERKKISNYVKQGGSIYKKIDKLTWEYYAICFAAYESDIENSGYKQESITIDELLG